ncbi:MULTISPECIES: cold shock domain-containing protein CspD [unclassified Pseudomonas]|uniref:cold shock domain-containing protein CspD n=1 Tax=unclassified Pseudomonas TaxID=196821 RepID=UPI002AC9143B|nr:MULTISPECIES: cold shock domain-containing protein CspD [unclassified Pseudomonas]MEB0042103.1 cold shock domain-containing protein CspD [Pseudomonas sp. MH10]MEB0078518.1 cold shock domain-containing protein CspD [Pseudomonas sp. MH10out]MEB0092182.1 cold shock domain-containing protein CspD [Pseudomonas sp. CCI4.2]MEB0100333.1 cold shock domain-containing protein CspD [Pseudomonas sp. CCI3.2]MEB0120257.1 cold shock domain-containing protein CspD [Pseudomonas sp. CCI1.2]
MAIVSSNNSVKHGKVKWFNNAKGYGFINENDKTEDLFAHYSAITMEGYKTLKAGQPVVFEIIQGPKGLHAVNIMATSEIQSEQPVAAPSETKTTSDVSA